MDSFEVENFRSLKHLKLEKLARVNLLVGKNNSGKTSVLEAIYSLCGIGSSSWYENIAKGRDIALTDISFRQLFYKVSNDNIIKLTAKYRGVLSPSEHRTSIEAILSLMNQDVQSVSEELEWGQSRSAQRPMLDDTLRISLQTDSTSSPAVYEISALENRTARRLKEVSKGSFELLKNIRDADTFRIQNSFISSRPRINNLGVVIERLKISKLDDKLVNVLQQVDNRIERVELGANGQIYFNLGYNFSTLLSANLMGEGMQRLLLIVSVIINKVGGIVFIDEIDNGLHYSVLRILWRSILQVAREYDVQIFATTHSAEALRHLTWVLDEADGTKYRDDVAAYTLIRAKDDTVRSYRYDYEQLEFAMEHDIEVRN